MITFCIPGRIEVGVGTFSRMAEMVKSLGVKKPLIVMDAFLASPAVGLDKKAIAILTEAGLGGVVYSGITGEPSSENVAEGLVAVASAGADSIIALGGGSAIDVAKAVAVLAVNPEMPFNDISKQAFLKRLPLVAVPTTSGTGSEATKVSVITNAKTGIKENPGHPSMVPDIAILDPELTITMPPALTSFTGMDALTHAMEAFVSNKANSMSDLFAYESMKLCGLWLEKAVSDGKDAEAREKMAMASCLGGIAFSNASTNLAHAGGRALGAYFHVPHGLSVALLLPFVMEFGIEAAKERYAKVAVALGANPHKSQDELAQQAIEIIYAYNDKFNIWQEAKNRYFPDLAAYRKAIPEMVTNTLSGNGVLTNRIVPNEVDTTLVFEKLAQKLEM